MSNQNDTEAKTCPFPCGLRRHIQCLKPTAPITNKPFVWVLGGPGSGKGTQCDKIVAKYGFVHLSTGDLLRDEVNSKSKRGKDLSVLMKQGQLVPNDVVLELLKEAIEARVSKANGFLIDGYPREKSQGMQFERTIAPVTVKYANLFDDYFGGVIDSAYSLGTGESGSVPGDKDFVILYFEASCETLTKRILGRALTSGRLDDNEETMKLRIQTFLDNNQQVLDQYPTKLRTINAERPVDEIFADVKKILDPIMAQNRATIMNT